MFKHLLSFVIIAAAATASGEVHAQDASVTSNPLVVQLLQTVNQSQCAAYYWRNRGHAPKAYMRGMALVFARSLCHPERSDVRVTSAAADPVGTEAEKKDGVTWYEPQFNALGLANDEAGADTLRNTYALMIGLGMRESSGQYCEGRDQSADFTQADTAEAGLFQTSWGASSASLTLPELYLRYSTGGADCLLETFSKNVQCGANDAENFGTGIGADWQQLTKTCPAFATEYAAVVLRKNGGRKGEFGPIRNHAAELRPECVSLLTEVQEFVADNPDICSILP